MALKLIVGHVDCIKEEKKANFLTSEQSEKEHSKLWKLFICSDTYVLKKSMFLKIHPTSLKDPKKYKRRYKREKRSYPEIFAKQHLKDYSRWNQS